MIGKLTFTVKPTGKDIDIYPETNNPVQLAEVFTQWLGSLQYPSKQGRFYTGVRFDCTGDCIAHMRITFHGRKTVVVETDDVFEDFWELAVKSFLALASDRQALYCACGAHKH